MIPINQQVFAWKPKPVTSSILPSYKDSYAMVFLNENAKGFSKEKPFGILTGTVEITEKTLAYRNAPQLVIRIWKLLGSLAFNHDQFTRRPISDLISPMIYVVSSAR